MNHQFAIFISSLSVINKWKIKQFKDKFFFITLVHCDLIQHTRGWSKTLFEYSQVNKISLTILLQTDLKWTQREFYQIGYCGPP